MIKQEIQQLLSQHKVNSISDIIYFVIEQVNKTLRQDPMDEVFQRLKQIQKSKGLDMIMIEQVKTIVQAMIDQRQQNLRYDLDKTINQQYQNIEHMISNINFNPKNQRQSLAEVDIINFLNTNSTTGGYQDDYRKTRQGFKQNFSETLMRDNILSDCNKIKQKIQIDKKEVSDLKFSLMRINRDISNKITVEQAHSIISDFQTKMYHKIQNEKLQLQKMEFKVKKDIQQQVFKIRKDFYVEIDLEGFKKDINQIKKLNQKLQKKVDKISKYKAETKQLSKIYKKIETDHQNLQLQLKDNKLKFSEYCTFNNSKNEDLNIILSQINEKLEYFVKIDTLQERLNNLYIECRKGQWLTEFKIKNQSIVWQKQLTNSDLLQNSLSLDKSSSKLFKFQTHKSQIIINEPGIYAVEFFLLETKIFTLIGSIILNNVGLQSSRKQFKMTGSNSLKCLIQITQKSAISLKINNIQNTMQYPGILKISKF